MSQLTDDDINNKKRNVEINVYYEKKYNSYLDVLKYFTLYVVGLLILTILRKRYYLSYGFTNILSFILIIIGSMHIYIKIADINARNNINFDEYDWTFDPSEHSDPNKLDNSLQSQSDGSGLSCVESDCCDPTDHKWCPATGKCVSTGNYTDSMCLTEDSASDSQTSNDENNYVSSLDHQYGAIHNCNVNIDESTCTIHNNCEWCPSESKCIPFVGVGSGCATNPGASSTTDIQNVEGSDAGLIHPHDTFVGKYVLDVKKNFSDFTNSIFNKNIHPKNKTTNVKSICQYDRNYATV